MCSSLNQSVTGKWNALMASVLVINPTPKPRNRISFFMDWEWSQGGLPKWKFWNCYQGSRVDAGQQKQHMFITSREQATPTEHILCPQKPGNEIWSEEPSWNLWLCLCSTDSLKHLFQLSWKNWNQVWWAVLGTRVWSHTEMHHDGIHPTALRSDSGLWELSVLICFSFRIVFTVNISKEKIV